MTAPWEFRVAVDGETLERFLADQNDVVGIQGPYGSGKTYAVVQKLVLNALRQPPNPKTGRRRRRTYVVRNTYDQIRRSVFKTWTTVLPPSIFGEPTGNGPFLQRIVVGDLDWEVVFLALDGTDDKAKLESAEPSDAWVNEARHLTWSTIKMLADRLGRFPPREEEGCILPQLLLDTNAPAEDHPMVVMSGQRPMPDNIPEEERARYIKPERWSFYVQPPAAIEIKDSEGNVTGYELNPARENQRFLPPDYYGRMLQGATRAEIRERVLNKPGTYADGKAVWPTFREETHVAKAPIEAVPGVTLIIGVDFGRTPAAIFLQRVFGQWRALHEFLGEGMGARPFARLLKAEMALRFPQMTYAIYGDPSGDNLAEADDISPFLMFRAEGLKILPASTNDPKVRQGAVEEVLNRMVDGRPGFLLSPTCLTLKAAMAGGYHFKRMQVSGLTRYSDQADKNRYSHPADALQYGLIGGGEGAALLGRTGGVAGLPVNKPTVVQRVRGWAPFRR